MLGQRVITAIVLLIVLVGALSAATPVPFEVLMAIFVACALWEWWRLTLGRPANADRIFLPEALAGLVLGVALIAWRWVSGASDIGGNQLWHGLWAVLSVVWVVVIVPWLVRANASGNPRSMVLTALAPFALLAAWSALIAAEARGVLFLLSLLALVWTADIAAYFTGRAFGKRKLAVHISPGKTLEGAAGGIIASVAFTLACSAFPGTFGTALVERWSIGGAAVIAFLLAALSIAGDLFESLLKRRAGFKDSSKLLPGHGGVFDRIDALVPVLPLALLLS